VQGLGQQRVRSQRRGHARAYPGARRRLGDVALDVVAPGEEERDEDGVRRAVRVQTGQGVREQGLVQLDVPEVDREAGALGADDVQERADGAQGAWVTAAVGDDDQRGRAGPSAAVEVDETWLAHAPILPGRGCTPVA